MSKPSAYQKLKAENLKLKQDLITLATEPESGKGLAIRTKWTIHKQMEEALWSGTPICHHAQHFYGWIKEASTKPSILNG